MDHADDRVAVPERSAHRRSDLLEADGLARLETLVPLRVGSQHGDLVPNDHVDDRPGVRQGPVGRHPLSRLEAVDPEPQLALLFEEQESAVDREVLEDQVHDAVEHGLEVVQ